MITWLILGYLAVSTLTFLFVYSFCIVAARADYMQSPNTTPRSFLRQPTKHVHTPTESFSLLTS